MIPAAPTLAFQPPDVTTLLTQRAHGLAAAQQLELAPCDTPEQEQQFAHFLTHVRETIKGLEDWRTSITGPLLEAKRGLDAMFKPAREPWEACESVIRAKLQGASQRRLEAALAAREAVAQAAAAGNMAGVSVALASVPEKVAVSGVGTGAEWILADADLTQVPREWLTLDMSKVKIHMRTHAKSEHIPAVPGLTFKRSATVRAK